MKRSILSFCSVLLLYLASHAQEKRADQLYEDWDYFQAAKQYEKAIAEKPSQYLYYKLGQCYQHMNMFDKALQNYDKVNQIGNYKSADFYMNYGLMLKTNERYAEAKEAFRRMDKMAPNDKRGKLYMNSCDIAIEDRKYDEPVAVTNVESINSSEDDFSPVIFKDGMVFTSSRHMPGHDKIYGRTGGYYFDILYVKNGGTCTDFSVAIPLRSCTGFNEPAPLQGNDINQGYHDGPVSFSKNYDTVFITRVKKDLEGGESIGAGIERNKIYSSRLVNNKWTELEPFYLNSDSYSVSLPFLTPDGQRLYFASDMKGGYGQSDIYYCERQGSGWGKPVNAGPMVNTFGREKFPHVDHEGNLFFSSDGYEGFGGLDICVAKKSGDSLVKAIPLKCPINSAKDDYALISLQNGKTGYFSSNRNGGAGKEDNYYFDLGMYSDLITKIYTIGYRPLPQDTARITITVIDAETKEQIKKGNFAATSKGKKVYESAFRSGTITFSVPERTKLNMRTSSDGYNTRPDTLYVGSMMKDTSISLVFELSRPDNLITLRGGSGKFTPARFDFAKYNIRPDAKFILDSVVTYMKKNKRMRVDICAHTDSRGTEEYNMNLSRLRARSAYKYLAARGISKSRMRMEANGFSQLLNGCNKSVTCTEDQHQENRRVEFKFNDDSKNTVTSQ